MKDALGDRMKANYENRTRFYLPRRTYTVIRIDGKAFHAFTARMKFGKPYSSTLSHIMDRTAVKICENIQGAKFCFVQSDEISIVLTDFDNLGTDAWFDGNIQKITSISASLATGYFNSILRENLPLPPETVAFFDARVFTIPSYTEVENYLIWRQQDAVRNSVQMLAQSLYSHRQLQGKNNSELQEMIFQKGMNWNEVHTHHKRGRVILRGDEWKWHVMKETPLFTDDRSVFSVIPQLHLL